MRALFFVALLIGTTACQRAPATTATAPETEPRSMCGNGWVEGEKWCEGGVSFNGKTSQFGLALEQGEGNVTAPIENDFPGLASCLSRLKVELAEYRALGAKITAAYCYERRIEVLPRRYPISDLDRAKKGRGLLEPGRSSRVDDDPLWNPRWIEGVSPTEPCSRPDRSAPCNLTPRAKPETKRATRLQDDDPITVTTVNQTGGVTAGYIGEVRQ